MSEGASATARCSAASASSRRPRWSSTSAAHAQYERAVTALEDAGFPRHTVLAVITAVESFVLGSALDLAAPPVMVTGIDAGTPPRLAQAASATPSGRPRADQAFHLGLDALITGLHHALSQPGSNR